AALDVRYGFEARLALPPTASSHFITASAADACTSPGASGTTSSGPIRAGGRYLDVLFRSGADLDSLTVDDRPPADANTPMTAFINAINGAPPLDVVRQFQSGDQAILFSAVPLGSMTDWVPVPTEDYDLFLSQRPSVKASFNSHQSSLVVAIGNWASGSILP